MSATAARRIDNRQNAFMALVDAAASLADAPGSPSSAAPGPVSDRQQAHKHPAALALTTATASHTLLSDGRAAAAAAAVLGTTTDEKKQTFPELLMSVLDDESNSDVMAWMPDGKAFTIRDPKRFARQQMPDIFNIRNMSSFVRKLGRWGFSRGHEPETKNFDIFKHPDFRRGDKKLCSAIRSVGSVKSAAARSVDKSAVASPGRSDSIARPVARRPSAQTVPGPLYHPSLQIKAKGATAVNAVANAVAMQELRASTSLARAQEPQQKIPAELSRANLPHATAFRDIHGVPGKTFDFTSGVLNSAIDAVQKQQQQQGFRSANEGAAHNEFVSVDGNSRRHLVCSAVEYSSRQLDSTRYQPNVDGQALPQPSMTVSEFLNAQARQRLFTEHAAAASRTISDELFRQSFSSMPPTTVRLANKAIGNDIASNAIASDSAIQLAWFARQQSKNRALADAIVRRHAHTTMFRQA